MDKPGLSEEQFIDIVDLALAEDVGQGDITSEILIPPDLQGQAVVLVKARGILAGIDVARLVFLRVDPTLKFQVLIVDGSRVKPGNIAATISGSVTSILKAERVALNFLQRLSGIATQTARYVTRARGFAARITDTRKTTPGLRLLEKYAVRMGGGHNHRLNLGDAILIKDNHVAILRAWGMSIKDIISQVKRSAPHGLKIEIEVNTIPDALEATLAGTDTVMLDNMSLNEMSQAVSLIGGRVKIEASGGVTLANVRAVAMTGVDIISIGALTHSPKALDISIELKPPKPNSL
jgi:nicotinate-nucleotide pyrophosphorylase (carboxylating)